MVTSPTLYVESIAVVHGWNKRMRWQRIGYAVVLVNLESCTRRCFGCLFHGLLSYLVDNKINHQPGCPFLLRLCRDTE